MSTQTEATKAFETPDWWGLSHQQDIVIGNLIEADGHWISPFQFCDALYEEKGDEEFVPYMVAPAKLRVLVQRCRDIVGEITDDKAVIITKRGTGWRLKARDRLRLINSVEPE